MAEVFYFYLTMHPESARRSPEKNKHKNKKDKISPMRKFGRSLLLLSTLALGTWAAYLPQAKVDQFLVDQVAPIISTLNTYGSTDEDYNDYVRRETAENILINNRSDVRLAIAQMSVEKTRELLKDPEGVIPTEIVESTGIIFTYGPEKGTAVNMTVLYGVDKSGEKPVGYFDIRTTGHQLTTVEEELGGLQRIFLGKGDSQFVSFKPEEFETIQWEHSEIDMGRMIILDEGEKGNKMRKFFNPSKMLSVDDVYKYEYGLFDESVRWIIFGSPLAATREPLVNFNATIPSQYENHVFNGWGIELDGAPDTFYGACGETVMAVFPDGNMYFVGNLNGFSPVVNNLDFLSLDNVFVSPAFIHHPFAINDSPSLVKK